jgi:GDP-L-fucose synthase
VAIPTNIYGPNDNWSLHDGHVIPSLVHRCYLAKKNGEDLTVWGSGTPLREFVFANDIAQLAAWALNRYSEDSPIIFTSGIEISIRDVVENIAGALNFKGSLIFDPSKPDGQFRKPSDPTKLKKYLPDFEFTGIEKGITNTVEWFEAHYPNVRM